MPLARGTRVGNYEVIAPLGAGGMGEVYRARDGRLGRDVALKVLPADLASDPERRQRFEQEARAASGLNHPNVVPVYDIGSAADTIFIAMELVEGRTIREVIESGRLPLKKFLDIAIQMADGLARAHDAGIVHRDLKPENVMVSRDGHLRLLDFGLAKLAEPDSRHADLTTSPALTRAGVVMGTVGYMSPEQAAGRPVDFRSDQFSFGAILYELVSGRRPFQATTTAETLTAILRESPAPLADAVPVLPPPLRWIIEERCLAKDPQERYASTRDLLRDLQGIRDHLSERLPTKPAASARRKLSWIVPVAALALGLVLGAWLDDRLQTATQNAPPTLRRLTFRRGAVPAARFSPDGQTVVYSAAFAGRPIELYALRMDSPESRPLDLPQSGLFAISPKGELAISIGQHTAGGWERTGTLGRVPLAGGAPREVMEHVLEADWSPDGQQLAVVRDVGGLRRLEYPLDKILYSTAGYISDIRISPAGDRVAFLDHPVRGDNAGTVGVVDVAGRKRTLSKELRASDGLAWSPSGDEVWFGAAHFGSTTKNDLWAVTLAGRERLLWRESGPVSLHDVSHDGRVILGRQNYGREIFGLAPGAADEQELSWLDWSAPLDLSEDGRTLLFDEEGEGAGDTYAIYVRKTDGSPAVRLGAGWALALSPDGRFALGSSGNTLLMLPIGTGMPRTLTLGTLKPHFAAFLPNGHQIVVSGNRPGEPTRLYIVPVSGGEPRAISPEGVSLALDNSSRLVSPDGHWIAANSPDGLTRFYPIAGGQPRAIEGLAPVDVVIRWTVDGRGLYVFRRQLNARVEILDLASGRRTLWKELSPADPAGVVSIYNVLISRDGKSYIYSYARLTEQLYLAEGLN